MADTVVRADFSTDRRETALRCLRDPEFATAPLGYEARLLYTVGLLICDDLGRMTQAAVKAAMSDPSIVQAARALLREARV